MLIFLDIDGVLIPAKNWVSDEILEDGFPAFSKSSIQALQKLISKTDSIILTSSHKSRFSEKQWLEIFRSRGIEISNLHLLPINETRTSRKDELENWFQSNSVAEDFIIIDDDKSLNDLSKELKKRLILTSPFIGLLEEHIDQLHVSSK